MQREAFRDDRMPGLYNSFSDGVQHGSLLFLSAMVGIDPSTGRLLQSLSEVPDEQVQSFALGRLAADSWGGPIQAQCWQLFRNIETILEGRGASLHDILRINMWVKDFTLLPLLMPVRSHVFAPHSPPPITNIGAVALCLPEAEIQVDVVVAIDSDGHGRRLVQSETVSQLVGDYALGAQSGSLTFGVGMIAARNDTRSVVRTYSDLAGGGANLASGSRLGDEVEGGIRSQTHFILDDLFSVLDDIGSSGSRVALVRVYMKDTGEYAGWEDVYLAAFPDAVPPTSVIPCTELGIRHFRLEIETISVDGNGDAPECVTTPTLPAMVKAAASLSRAEGLIFIPGQYGIDANTGQLVSPTRSHAGDIAGLSTGSLLAQRHEGPVTVQTARIFQNLSHALEELGSGLADVLALYLYVTDAMYIPIVERVAGHFFEVDPPACSIVVVPQMPLKGAVVQIEAVAADTQRPPKG